MIHLIFQLLILFPLTDQVIFDFNQKSDANDWYIVDDVVMGGRSSGSFRLDAEGYGVFEGSVSLENNGGFSSVRHRFLKINTGERTKVILRLKGDGKQYQFRVKANSRDYYSYVKYFQTSGEWQEIEIVLNEMYPSYRGRKLEQPNFSEGVLEEVAILIANKKAENFKLVLDKIELK